LKDVYRSDLRTPKACHDDHRHHHALLYGLPMKVWHVPHASHAMCASHNPGRVASMALRWMIWSLAALCLVSPAFGSKLEIVYPRPIANTDVSYPVALLDLALREAGIEYTLHPSQFTMQQNRALLQVADNVEINVVWSMTSRERERDLMPIRIPIDKGLLGWRIFFINGKNAARWKSVQNLDQLRTLSAGQEHDWPDVQILTANRLPVVQSADYDSLFNMLMGDRFDYFPRSIQEIWDEEKKHHGMDIMVEQSIILHYPAAEYFFVSKHNKPLADALEKGLRAAIKDGSFERLFIQHNGKALALANIRNRKVFRLNNPDLPDETPLAQKNLWLEQ
jgi:hypothetical protein